MQLWIKSPGAAAGIEAPYTWLAPTAAGTGAMPQGWSLSADTDATLAYSDAVIANDSVILRGPDASVTEFRKTSSGGWAPKDADDSVLTMSSPSSGPAEYTVHGDDGLVYTFDSAGKLIRVVSVADSTKPAAPIYNWSSSTSRLANITDPVSGRALVLTYQGGSCPTAPSGFDAAPPSLMLCQLAYPDTSVTKLFYRSGQLARIEDPGSVITDFAYDATGRLSAVRSPLMADMIAAGLRTDDANASTALAYDAQGRVSTITSPAPTSGASRLARAYSYGANTTSATISGGGTRTVTFDAGGRTLTDRDPDGYVTTTTWDTTAATWDTTGDLVTSVTDAAGLKSTTLYDHANRPITSYGPARATVFGSDNRPLADWVATTPATFTRYDEGMVGLAAAYWNNSMFAGAPAAHRLGVGTPTGTLDANWGTATPVPAVTADAFSARYTGEIYFPAAGNYSFNFAADDNVRLYVDDKSIVDFWGTCCAAQPSGTFYGATAGWHRIRVDYRDTGGPASLQMSWSGSGVSGVVPGDYLRPRYGLATSSLGSERGVSKTEYAVPYLGMATATVEDTGGLALRSTVTYEPEGSGGYLRRTQRTLPKGAETAVSYAYYGAAETASDPCMGTAAVSQAGFLKTTTAADPDGSGPQAAIVREVRYDVIGRVIATRVVGDSAWSCVSYDNRGRVFQGTDRTGRVTTNSYGTPGVVTTGYTDSAGASRSTRGEADGMGRSVQYTDEQGATFRNLYDNVGRLGLTYRTLNGQAEKMLTILGYTPAGRPAAVQDYATGVARQTTYDYDTSGRLMSSTASNGVKTTRGYDAALGHLSSIAFSNGAAALGGWSATRTPQGSKLASETVFGATRSYTYDRAERLVAVADGSTTRSYAYDANSNRCANAASCVSPTYNYDAADRLTASPYASAYSYDSHGNMTSSTSTVTGTKPFEQGVSMAPDETETQVPVHIGRSGILDAVLAWPAQSPTVTRPISGVATMGASVTGTIPVIRRSRIATTLQWPKQSYNESLDESVAIPAAASAPARAIDVTAAGTINASLSWGAVSKPYSFTGGIRRSGSASHSLTVTRGGTITATLTWPAGSPNPNLDLDLQKEGVRVARSAATSGNTETITYVAPAPSSSDRGDAYSLVVRREDSGSTTATYTLAGNYPVNPIVGLRLENAAGTVLTDVKPRSDHTSLSLTNDSYTPGIHRLVAYSSDFATTATLKATYPTAVFAPVTLSLRDPAGAIITEVSGSTGTLDAAATVPVAGAYTWVAKNTSTKVSAGFVGQTSATTLTDVTATGALAPATTATHSATSDGPGWANFALSYQASAGGGYANLALRIKNAAGALVAEASEADGSISLPVSLPATGVYSVEITETGTALGTPSYILTSTTPDYREDLISLKLYDQANTLLATGAGTTTARVLTANLTPGVYKLSVSASGGPGGSEHHGLTPRGLGFTRDHL